MRILLAEDEPALSRALVTILKRNNFSVDAVYNGDDAYDYVASGLYDIAVLDIMMPRKDGLTVLKELRAAGNRTPVIMLTAKSQTDDKISGLDAGADDYITKPFEMRELIARIRAVARRRDTVGSNVLKFGNVSLDCNCCELSAAGGSVRLGRKEFQMLELMMQNPGVAFSADKFMDKIWDVDSTAELNVVWVYISALRKKLASVGADVAIVVNRNIGYCLEITGDTKA